MHWTSALSIVLSTAIYRGIVHPAQMRFRAWKADPNRVPVARPNWRGVYVPDLTMIRLRRLGWAGAVLVPLFGFASLLFIIPHQT